MSSTRTRRGGAVEPASAAAAAPAGPVHPVNVLRYSACAGKTTPTVSSSPGVHRVFQHVLEHAGDSAASLLRSSNQATLLDIATFVHSCHHVANGSNPAPAAGPTRSEAGPSIRGGGIPTGVIMSGSSVQDRPLSLGALEAAILAKGPARFACASSANATSLGGVLASILGHFLGEQELPAKHCSSRNLLDWAATLEVMSPLVILIRDIEAFDPQVLSDLVGVMHQELHTLPIVLLLTVATTAQALPRMLPHAA
ncbi:origin recognition complex subunit 3 N-terminus-domain-containing protein, partial [Baffinella frigidus]